MFRTSLRTLVAHKLRLMLTGLAVVLGVGFVAGTYVFTDSLQHAFDQLFVVRSADVVVSREQPLETRRTDSDPSQALDESILATVAAVPGVAAATGVVSADGAVVLDRSGRPVTGPDPSTRGSSWIADPALRALTLVDGREPVTPDEVVLGVSTAQRAGVGVGERLQLVTPRSGGRAVDVTVVGIGQEAVSASFGGGTTVVFSLAGAQAQLLAPGRLSQVLAVAAPGVSQPELERRIDAVVGPQIRTTTGQQLTDDVAERLGTALGFVTTFLLVFALIALFVAGFLIFNTFSMLVAARTRELALLRALGASRRQVRTSVLLEAAVMAVLASTAGLAAGLGLALLLRRLFDAVGVDLPPGGLQLLPRTVVVVYLVGVGVTLVAAWLPSRRAGTIPPVAALRDDVALPVRSLRVRAVAGTVLVLTAVVVAWRSLGVLDDPERAAGVAGLSAFFGVLGLVVLAPVLARPALRVLGAVFGGIVGRLARENGRRNPRRTAATASALMIGLGLMTAIGVIAASTSASTDRVIDDTIGADFVVFGPGFRPFSHNVFEAIRDSPNTRAVAFARQTVARTGSGDRVPVTGSDPAQLAAVIDLDFTTGRLEGLGLGGAAVDSTTAANNGYRVGQVVPLTFPNGAGQLRLQAVYEPAGPFRGFITSVPTITAVGTLEEDSAVYVRAAPGADVAALRAELQRRLTDFPAVQVQDQAQVKEDIRGSVDAVLNFVLALLALAVVIAVLGIVNTLLLSVVERTRELGLLRAVGTSRRQVALMITEESVLLGVFGAVLGVGTGLAYGVLLQRVLAPQGITELAVPVGQLVGFVLVGAIGGVIASVWPAIRAARLDVLRAIAVE
ncbi:MAG: FtsX-like permease family protein [Actinomycetota bacterium]|nr:MAG: FtsX-like permease family protein [Actinomycetota bacterium]